MAPQAALGLAQHSAKAAKTMNPANTRAETGAETDARIAAAIARHSHREGPLLPILHDLQAEFGFVPAQAQDPLAEALGISRAEVLGVISFYHEFRDHPPGRQVLKICRAEACQARGAAALEAAAKARTGLDWHQTSANGALTLEPVYCLGLCACGPAGLLGDRLLARLDDAAIDRIAREAGL